MKEMNVETMEELCGGKLPCVVAAGFYVLALVAVVTVTGIFSAVLYFAGAYSATYSIMDSCGPL